MAKFRCCGNFTTAGHADDCSLKPPPKEIKQEEVDDEGGCQFDILHFEHIGECKGTCGEQGESIQTEAPIVVFARPQRLQPNPATGSLHMRRQRDSFVPSFLVVPAGRQVRFENVDSLCHNVFSTSDQNAFETGLCPGYK